MNELQTRTTIERNLLLDECFGRMLGRSHNFIQFRTIFGHRQLNIVTERWHNVSRQLQLGQCISKSVTSNYELDIISSWLNAHIAILVDIFVVESLSGCESFVWIQHNQTFDETFGIR